MARAMRDARCGRPESSVEILVFSVSPQADHFPARRDAFLDRGFGSPRTRSGKATCSNTVRSADRVGLKHHAMCAGRWGPGCPSAWRRKGYGPCSVISPNRVHMPARRRRWWSCRSRRAEEGKELTRRTVTLIPSTTWWRRTFYGTLETQEVRSRQNKPSPQRSGRPRDNSRTASGVQLRKLLFCIQYLAR